MNTQTSYKIRFFSVELKSKAQLKNVTLNNGTNENVLVEGTIGKLLQAEFNEGVMLEVVGDCGVLRVDLAENELKKADSQTTDSPLATQDNQTQEKP